MSLLVSWVALDCLEAMSLRPTSSGKLIARPLYKRVPTIFWILLIPFLSNGGESSTLSVNCTLAPKLMALLE